MSIPILVLPASASEEQSQVVDLNGVECSLESGQQQSDSGINFYVIVFIGFIQFGLPVTIFCCFLICLAAVDLPTYM